MTPQERTADSMERVDDPRERRSFHVLKFTVSA